MIAVRVCGAADVDALAALRRAWNEESGDGPVDDPGFETRFRTWFEDERASRTFFLVEVDGVPVGMANVKHYCRMPAVGRDAGSWGYVGNVFVLPHLRNGGVGAELMLAIERWAKECGLGHLRLAPRDEARRFYQRLGYAAGAVVELDP